MQKCSVLFVGAGFPRPREAERLPYILILAFLTGEEEGNCNGGHTAG